MYRAKDFHQNLLLKKEIGINKLAQNKHLPNVLCVDVDFQKYLNKA